MYTMGENSIFKKAQEAKNRTEEAIKNEREYMNNIDNILNEYITGNETTKKDTIQKGEIAKKDKINYTDETGTAVIPGGFCVVKDSVNNPTDKNTVVSGLVISDVENDDLENSKHGNQFVWVPVEDYSKFHLIEGYENGNFQTMLSEATNPSREAGESATAGSPGKPNAANNTAGSTESIAMYKSVKENKGFYIARFEAGIAGTTESTTTNDANKQTQDGSVKPVSQKGVGVWNFIPWGGTGTDIATDNLPGNDNSDGAVKVARSMYKNDSIHKVTSTLCYGVQWDAVLNFIDSNYEKGTATGYIKDSTGKGNYSNSIAVTGSNIEYQQKHIYDMAGSEWEWTMEAYDTDKRIGRGGGHGNDGGERPASSRYNNRTPDANGVYLGFRIALFL